MCARAINLLIVGADAGVEWNQIGASSVYICRERAAGAVGRRGWRGGLRPWQLRWG